MSQYLHELVLPRTDGLMPLMPDIRAGFRERCLGLMPPCLLKQVPSPRISASPRCKITHIVFAQMSFSLLHQKEIPQENPLIGG